MHNDISKLKTRFYKHVVKNDTSFTLHDDLGLKRNFGLYEDKHEIFKSLCQQDDGRALVRFFINMAVNDQPMKQEWEPKNRGQIAWKHLQCFCEKTCYWVAEKLTKSENNRLVKDELIEQYLYYARSFIYDFEIFKEKIIKYNMTESLLETYIEGILDKHIKNKISNNRFKYSPMRLLYKKSDIELQEALAIFGCSESDISQKIFARKYFKIVYSNNHLQNSKKKGWTEANELDYTEATKYYNSERKLPSAPYEVFIGQDITVKNLEDWMNDCIKALYNFPELIKRTESLDDNSGKDAWKCDEYNDDDNISINRTDQVLKQMLLSLNELHQKRVFLHYGFHLSQEQIAAMLSIPGNNITQSSISKSLKENRKFFVIGLSSEYEYKTPQEWVKNYVQKWLDPQFSTPVNLNLFHRMLDKSFKTMTVKEREVLRLKYGERFNDLEITIKLGFTENDDIMKFIDKTQAKLEKKVLDEIDNFVEQLLKKSLPRYFEKLSHETRTQLENLKETLKLDPHNQEKVTIINNMLTACLKLLNSPQQ